MPSDHDLEPLRHRNFRDLVGLPTRGGEVVARQRFFRSGNLLELEGPDASLLASLNLRTVIDLRTAAEVAQCTSLADFSPARVFRIPLFDAARDNWIAPPDQSPHATASRYFEMLSDGVASFTEVLLTLARHNSAPFLLFCTAGRDRTGIVVACLLDLLGVTDGSIASDYAQSDQLVDDGSRAHAGTIVELLRLIRHHFGSTQQMVQARGAPPEAILTLRRQLLVSAL